MPDGVLSSRKSRAASGEARARGIVDRKFGDGAEFVMGDTGLYEPRPLPWCGDETSGCPFSLHETAIAALAAGFQPDTCWFLADKIKSILKVTIDSRTEGYRYPVPMSCSAIIVPGNNTLTCTC